MIVPLGVWLLLILALAMGGLLKYTRFGRHTFAIGSNEQTARLCGVAVQKVKLWVYSLSAGFAGLAGVMQFSRLTVGDPTVAMDWNWMSLQRWSLEEEVFPEVRDRC